MMNNEISWISQEYVRPHIEEVIDYTKYQEFEDTLMAVSPVDYCIYLKINLSFFNFYGT